MKRPIKRDDDDGDDLGIKPLRLMNKPRSWAIYGRSGSGKTTFAATFPRPILLLDIRDQGTDSVADQKDIYLKEIESWDDVEDVYYHLKKTKKYKTVVFDTITQLQQLILEEIVREKNKKVENIGDWGTVTLRQYGDVAAKLKLWITNFRDLPLEVVFLAQEKTTGSEEEENPDNMIVPEVGPNVMKSVATALNAAVSVIGNTFIRMQRTRKVIKGKKYEKDNVAYSMRIGPNPIYTTKIRKPKSVEPPDRIDNPTYEDIMEVIRNSGVNFWADGDPKENHRNRRRTK